MPDIDFAFLADAADARPGEKFSVLGGGISRIGGRGFPIIHPHVALVIGLQVTAAEIGRDHELRFLILAPDGSEIADATGTIRAEGQPDGHDQVVAFAVDFWNLSFPTPGEYTVRILVAGSERKRIPLIIAGIFQTTEPPGAETGATRRLDA